ncbi:retrovirus-related pol polyprotein from transposon TNT 1-94 [Tanacetum coccineum]
MAWNDMDLKTAKTSLPVKIKAPKELPKIRLVNESLKKIKFHFVKFDNVVKIRTTPNARTEGELGFEHTKVMFNNEIIPFLKSLKDIFNVFDRDLLNEIMEVKTVFDQMDAAVQQSSVDKQCLEIAKKELLLENDRILQQIMSQDVRLTVMNSMSLIGETMNMDGMRNKSCDKCFNLEAELLKSQNAFNDLLKSHSQLEKHCISLECSIQLNQEIVFKEQFDSIKQTRVRSKEQSDSLIDKLNLKSAENEDLKAQIQDKVFVITSLKNDLQKIKGKEIVDIAAQIPSANTIILGMFKLDLEPLEIVEQAKAEQPLDKELDFAYNGTEFVNQTFCEFYENVGISNQTTVARTPQQNGIVERQNRTLVEAARTISGPGLHSMTPPMFDEYFTHPSIVVSPVQEAAALRVVVLANSPVSTSIDKDAPSTSIPST